MRDQTIPVRVTKKVKAQFVEICKKLETTPSEYLRQLIGKEIEKGKGN